MTAELEEGDYTKRVNIDINGCGIYRHSPRYPDFIWKMLEIMVVSKNNTLERIRKYADARKIKISIDEDFDEDKYTTCETYKYDDIQNVCIEDRDSVNCTNEDEEYCENCEKYGECLDDYYDTLSKPETAHKTAFVSLAEIVKAMFGRKNAESCEYPKYESYYVYARPKKEFKELAKWFNDLHINPSIGLNPFVK